MRTLNIFFCVAVAATFCTASLAGAPPPAGASAFAVVGSDGSLVRGNAIGASQINTGAYIVEFGHSVKRCVFTATTGSTSVGTPPDGSVTVAGANGDPTGVYVTTFNATGDAADAAFHLNVRC